MAEKPVMHGRDHRPGGTDPIPGLTSGLPWALQEAPSGYTIDHTGGTNYVNLDSGDFYTSDSSIYTNATFTHTGGSSVGCLQINAEGFYRVTVNGNWTTIESAAVGETNIVVWDVTGGGGVNPGWLFGRQAVKGNDTFAGVPGVSSSGVQTFFQVIVNVPSAQVPTQIAAWALQYNATLNATLDYVQVYAEQVNPAAFSGSFFPLFPPYN